MIVNNVLNWMLLATGWIVIPFEIVTTVVVGLPVTVTFGLFLLPISLIWMVFHVPILAVSYLLSRCEFLRTPVGIIATPWVFAAHVFTCFMSAMGELENRTARLFLTEVCPYSWEFWQVHTGNMSLFDSSAHERGKVIDAVV